MWRLGKKWFGALLILDLLSVSKKKKLSQQNVVEFSDELELGLSYVIVKLACLHISPEKDGSNCAESTLIDKEMWNVIDLLSLAYIQNPNRDWEVISFIASTSNVIRCDNDVALIKKAEHFSGQYRHLELDGECTSEYFSGGMCEYKDASPKASAAREIEEKTGMQIDRNSLELLGVNFYNEHVTISELGIEGVEKSVFMPTYGCTLNSRPELR